MVVNKKNRFLVLRKPLILLMAAAMLLMLVPAAIMATEMSSITVYACTIDIKPGSDNNTINSKSKGSTPVAVLGSADLDVSRIDAGTVLFAGAPALGTGELKDINADGIMDVIFCFKTQELNLSDTNLVLEFTTLDGQNYAGCESASPTDPGYGGGSEHETADLTDIQLSGSPENYSFRSNTYAYSGVNIPWTVESITVAPSGKGTITIEGQAVASGTPSAPISLTSGEEKTITVVVAQPNRTPKTYTIGVTRDNPPPPPEVAAAFTVNNQEQPNTITVVSSEALNEAEANNASNWTVASGDGSTNYGLASAALLSDNQTVVITLNPVNAEDNTTFITNQDAQDHLVITMGSGIHSQEGIASTGQAVTGCGETLLLDTASPTVQPLGDGSEDVLLQCVIGVPGLILTFNEPVAEASRTSIEDAIRAGAAGDGLPAFAWTNNSLTISLSTDQPPIIDGDNISIYIGSNYWPDDVYADVSDLAGNTANLLLIDSATPPVIGTDFTVNNQSRPNKITVVSCEPLNREEVETEANWIITNQDGSIVYRLANAALQADNTTVVLTLNSADPDINNTHITNADARAHLKVTMGSGIHSQKGVAGSGAAVIGSEENLILDTTAPTVGTLGNGATNYKLAGYGTPVNLQFSEPIASADRWNILSAVCAGQDTRTLYATWPNNSVLHLENTATSSISWGADVYADATDMAGNAAHLLLINSATQPVISANFVVNNQNKPNTITVMCNEALSWEAGYMENWTVTDNSGSIRYQIAGINLENGNTKVVLTLAGIDPANAPTFITNAAARAHLKVTMSSAVKSQKGVASPGVTVTGSGETLTLDTTPPGIQPLGDGYGKVSITNGSRDIHSNEPLSMSCRSGIESAIRSAATGTGVMQIGYNGCDSCGGEWIIVVVKDGTRTWTQDVYADVTDVAGNTTRCLLVNVPEPPRISANFTVSNDGWPHRVQVKSSEPLGTSAQNPANWRVANSAGTVYPIRYAQLYDGNTVTLELYKPEPNTMPRSDMYITNADARAHLKVTMGTGVISQAGISSTGETVTGSGETLYLDDTAPTVQPVGDGYSDYEINSDDIQGHTFYFNEFITNDSMTRITQAIDDGNSGSGSVSFNWTLSDYRPQLTVIYSGVLKWSTDAKATVTDMAGNTVNLVLINTAG